MFAWGKGGRLGGLFLFFGVFFFCLFVCLFVCFCFVFFFGCFKTFLAAEGHFRWETLHFSFDFGSCENHTDTHTKTRHGFPFEVGVFRW